MNASLAEIIAKDESGGYSDAEFDDALWLALCQRVRSVQALVALPFQVQTYFASRYVEFEVGNGAFAQAVLNVPQFLEPAARAFEELKKPRVAAKIREAERIYRAELGALPVVRPGNEPTLSDYFIDNAFAHLDQQLEDIDFWSDAQRLTYVRANRNAFLNVA